MPVSVTRSYVVKAGDQTIVLSPEEIQKSVETEVTVTCSGPRCQARNARSDPFSVTWKEEEAVKDPLSLPDGFFTMLKITPDPTKQQEFVFCGRLCAIDYLQYSYVPPQPPRIALENAKREQESKLAELNPHLVQKTDNLPSSEDLDSVAREQEIAAITGVSDSTGYVDQETDTHVES